MKENLAEVAEAMVQEKNKFSAWVREINNLQEKARKITGAKRSAEQKDAFSEKR